MKPSKLCLWLLSPILFGCLHGIGCRLLAGPADEANEFVKEQLLKDSEMSTSEMDLMGFYVYPKDINGTQHVNWVNVVAVIQNSIEISSSGIIMIIFGMKCYKAIGNLNSKKTRSNQYQSVQTQLFTALVLQTFIPLVLMYIPSGIIIIFCLADQSFELFGRVLCVSIALYPVLDPLPNMFVINSFRNAFLSKQEKVGL
ncbi:hypothetical protein CAEBREN_10698 [Caenorhabditis brenneri]|uniref:Uncharacterized protein n=1 Tax=Caenorhabditis brenneri TaxID=135651 RepID=G0NZ96_CAEBE|nr:hypothetical protein CAEBREN_10698 [Caenorhabditis brenneri]